MGKITVKHFLNTKLKPELDEDVNEKYYPLYYTVIVNSKNIKRRSNITDYITEAEFKSGCKGNQGYKRKIEYESDLISRIVKLYLADIENHSEKVNLFSFFDLKGYNSKDKFLNLLNAYIDFYSHSIYEAVWNYCTDMIESEVYSKLTRVFKLPHISISKEIFKYNPSFNNEDLIIKDLNKDVIIYHAIRERLQSFLAPYNKKTGYDIPLIDWMEGRIQEDLKDFLKERSIFEILKVERDESYFSSSQRTLEEFHKSQIKTKYIKEKILVFDDSTIERVLSIIDDIIYSKDYFEIAKSRRNY